MNLQTRTTGTVHAPTTDGAPLCPARSRTTAQDGAYAETSSPVTCRSCLKRQAAADMLDTLAAVEPPAEGCAPWCAEHDDCTGGGQYPADPPNGTCWAPTVPTPGGRYGDDGSVALTHDGEDGTLIQIITGHDTLLTVEEAEQFAAAILTQTRLARTTVPATPESLELVDVEGGCPNPGCRICTPTDR